MNEDIFNTIRNLISNDQTDIAIKNLKFNSSNPNLYSTFIQLLTAGNFMRPKDVAESILSLLKKDTQGLFNFCKADSIRCFGQILKIWKNINCRMIKKKF